MMHVYLVRHGDALAATENPLRPLSPAGRERVERLAQAAWQRGSRPAVIWHSGILRAAETAEILARRFGAGGTAAVSGLLPEDDPAVIQAELAAAAESTMIVGHLPFLARLSALLLHGDPNRPGVEFAPASMACLARSDPQWKISWQIAP